STRQTASPPPSPRTAARTHTPASTAPPVADRPPPFLAQHLPPVAREIRHHPVCASRRVDHRRGSRVRHHIHRHFMRRRQHSVIVAWRNREAKRPLIRLAQPARRRIQTLPLVPTIHRGIPLVAAKHHPPRLRPGERKIASTVVSLPPRAGQNV